MSGRYLPRSISVARVSSPSFEGTAEISFRITPTGRTNNVSVKWLPASQRGFAVCLEKSIGRWRFPKPEGAAPVATYPIVFKKGK